jgi:hypothetical protein
MPLQATSGAASQDAFGGNGVAVVPAYIEDVFSTYLYTGTGANLTITNNIDLSTNGGLVWIKNRSAVASHRLFDTARGATKYLTSSGLPGSSTDATSLTAFNSTGFSLGNNDAGDDTVNGSTYKYASWSFRKQSKFFDIQTWTGDGANRTISHSLGSVPACILVKRTSSGNAAWAVYHRSLANTQYLVLNDTAAAATGATWWNSTTPTSSVFSLGTDATVNESGKTYIAYIFAHDAGGFGLTGADNVISCGSFTTDGSGNATVNLGYEPQWVLQKPAGAVGNWDLMDIMRGYSQTSVSRLQPNTNSAEGTVAGNYLFPTATGFQLAGNFYGLPSTQFIYIAIRRGPMKVPTLGTSVFSPIAYTGNSTSNTTVQNLTTNFAGDTVITQIRNSAGNAPLVFDKLRGSTQAIYTANTDSEENISTARPGQSVGFNNTQTVLTGQFTSSGNYNLLNYLFIAWNFRRAPGFFDEVCYTGTGSARTISHNLGVAPELYIVKGRSSVTNWSVGSTSFTALQNLVLNDTAALDSSAQTWNSTYPTASVFSVGGSGQTNGSGTTFVAYLFATCAGVSKVGSYTGTGAAQTINCGFTGGARFVLVKRTDLAGDWYVWDTARGMVSGTDPSLLLNSTAAEVNANSVYTATTGFQIVSTAAGINASGGAYIFLAIA